MLKIYKPQANIIETHKMTWEALDANHIQVCFNGTLDERCILVEDELAKAGLFAIKRSYNKKLNKTFTTYKKAGNFK